MPTVPKYDNLQTNLNVQPSVQFQPPSGPTPGAISAEQASQFGKAATSAGDALGRIQMDVAERADQVRVSDARNRLSIAQQDLAYNKDTGFLTRKGANVFLDAEGKPLTKSFDQEYGEKLKTQIDSIASGLGNDRQRQAFALHAGDASAQFHGQLQSHTLTEFNRFGDVTDDAKAKLAQETAVLNWNKPDIITSSMTDAIGAIRSKAERAGLVGAPFDAAVLAGTSAVHEGIIHAALQNNNPAYAATYLKEAREKKEMTGADILKVQGHITEADALKQSQGAVQKQTVESMPGMAPTGFDRLKQVRTQLESGGRGDFNPDGTPLESTILRNGVKVAGAKYKNQVMDATAANPGFGIKAADMTGTPQQVAAEYNRVGDQLLEALVQKYGTADKALAAYNWGSGNVDKAMEKARNGKGGANGENGWQAYLPPETKNYVANAAKLLGGNAPVVPRPTEMDFVNGSLAKLGPDASPQAVKHTRDAAMQQFGVITKTLNEKGDNAVAEAQRFAINNNLTIFAELPPQLKDAVTQYAPGKMDELKQFVEKQGNVQTDRALYQHLTTPGILSKYTDNQFFTLSMKLSPEDAKQFAKQRSTEMSGGGGTGFGDLNTTAITEATNARLQMLKIDTTPKDGSDDAAQLGGVKRMIRNSVANAQQQAGRKFTDVETAQHIDNMFAKDMPFRTTVLGMTIPGGDVKSQPLLMAKVGDIPSDVKASLKKDFAVRGNMSPTDQDYVGAFVKYKMVQPKQRVATGGATGSY